MPATPSAITPVISVVVPSYNAERFLARAVRSALGQRGVEWLEVIVVDDVSSDGSVRVAHQLAAEDSRVKVLVNEVNRGPGGSRNAGIAAATGEWIALLDADDALAEGRLSRLVDSARESGSRIVADLPVLFDLQANVAAPTQLPAKGGWQLLEPEDLLSTGTVEGLDLGLLKPMFHRSLAESGLWRYSDARHGEDFILYLDLLCRGERFTLLHEAHYIFSTRVGEVSGRYSPGSVTSVDYRGIARDSLALAAAHGTRPGGGELSALLRGRAERALTANRAYGWTVLRKREWRRLWQWAAKDWENAPELAAIALRKLFGHRGRV